MKSESGIPIEGDEEAELESTLAADEVTAEADEATELSDGELDQIAGGASSDPPPMNISNGP